MFLIASKVMYVFLKEILAPGPTLDATTESMVFYTRKRAKARNVSYLKINYLR